MTERVEQADSTSLRAVGRNTSILFSAQLVTWVISATVTAIVPRFLGPVAVGQYAIALSLWTIATVFVAFGMPMLVTLETARDRGHAGTLVGPVLRARSMIWVLAYVVVIAFCAAVGYDSITVAVAAILGFQALISGVSEVSRATLIGIEKAGRLARAEVAAKAASAAAIIAVVLSTGSLYGLAAVNVAMAVVMALIFIRALSAETTIRYRSTTGEAITTARRGAPYLLIGMTLIAYQQVDVIVMSMLVDERQIGWYGAADTLFGTLLFAPAILMTALLPALTREHAADPARARQTVRRAFDMLTVIAIPIGLLTVVVARPFVELLYGERFSEAGAVLAVFGVVLLFTFFSVLFGNYALAVGRQTEWNRLMIVAIIATIPLDLVLVPWTDDRYGNGAIGGAITFVITEAAMVAYGIWRYAPGLLDGRRLVRIAKCAVAGGALLATAKLLDDVLFIAQAAVAGVAYVVVLILTRVLDRQEIDALKHIARPGRTA
jgi:O-antigen/teichoic acid export membrane protein